jgi:hypothetical protein
MSASLLVWLPCGHAAVGSGLAIRDQYRQTFRG